MSFCLPEQLATEFKKRLKSGEINPDSFAELTSDQRRSVLSDFLGEEMAKNTNALFESKLLLKNQKAGMLTWAKTVAGLKPEIRRDILAKVERMTEVLNPKTEKAFLEDLASYKLGVNISLSEAVRISDLAKKVSEEKVSMEKGGDRMDYGRAVVEFNNYVNDLKIGKITLKDIIKSPTEIAGQAKSIKASFDNSAIFRQGWKTLMTNPGIWIKNARQSFTNIWNTLGGKNVMDELNADIVSRPNYDLMKKSKLDVGTIEEAFPTALPEKVPYLGKIYKASQDAFTAFVHKTRADIFDKYIEIAKASDIDLTSRFELESIGRVVNSLTGRSNLGRLEPIAGVVNNVFFSPRFAKSHIDVLLSQPLGLERVGGQRISTFARRQAAINVVKIVGGTAAILTIAKAINPDAVELDPRSADFGKIRIGDTRFDVSGGMASYITLAARLITMESKSSTTGLVSKINSGEFGALEGTDLIYNFFENKLSPAASVVKDLLKQQDFQGRKPTLFTEAQNLFVPIPITNYQELRDNPNSANLLLAILADVLGIGTNTYSIKSDWNRNPGVELTQFKNKVGEKKFQEANDLFNKKFNDWFWQLKENERYQELTDDEKQRVMSSKRAELKQDVFKKYGFTYIEEKKTKLPKF